MTSPATPAGPVPEEGAALGTRIGPAYLRTWGQSCIIAAVFLVPIAFTRATLDPFGIVKLSLIGLTAVLALGSWIGFSAARSKWMPRSKVIYLGAAFAAAYLLAGVLSENRALSLLGVYRRYGGLAPIVLYALFGLALVGLFWEQPGRLGGVATAVFASSLVLTGYVMVQGAGRDWVSWSMPDGLPPVYPIGTLGNSNFAGGFLAISLPFVVLKIISAQKVKAQLALFVLAAEVVALWLTSSRGAMIGAAAGLGAMALLFADRLPRRAKRALVIGGLVSAALAVLVLSHAGQEKRSGPLGGFETLRTDTLEVRRFYWTAALRIFADHPIVGTGPDTFYANYGRYRTEEDGRQMGLRITDKPHNIYLEYAANSGILGAGTYLGMAGLALFYALQRNKGRDDPNRNLLVAFTGSFVAYLGQGFFSIDVPPLALMGWTMIGAIAVLADPGIVSSRASAGTSAAPTSRKSGLESRANNTRAPRYNPAAARTAVVGCALALAVFLLVGLRPLYADVRAKAANSLLQRRFSGIPGTKQAVATMEGAAALYPLEATYFRSAGSIWQSIAERTGGKDAQPYFTRSAERLHAAQLLQPRNVFIAMDVARLNDEWAKTLDKKRFLVADRAWRRAVSLDPNDWQVRFNYAAFLNGWGLAAGQDRMLWRAIGIFERLAKIHPEQPRVWKSIGQSYLAVGKKPEAQRALSRALRLSPHDPSIASLIKLTEEANASP